MCSIFIWVGEEHFMVLFNLIKYTEQEAYEALCNMTWAVTADWDEDRQQRAEVQLTILRKRLFGY